MHVPWTIEQIAEAANASCVIAPSSAARVVVSGVSTDTRALRAGEMFVAIRGERFDGHDFVAEATRKGAACALVDERHQGRSENNASGIPLVVVADTVDTLGRMAARVRAESAIPWIGITGSAGKTTTKELAAATLAPLGCVLKSPASFNNRIGVPLTVLALWPEHRAAVVEVGSGAPGEIAPLAGMVRPTIAVVTTIGPAHLESFGDVGAVAREKAELVRALDPDGVAILPAESEWLESLREAAPGRVVTFGLSEGADVRAEHVEQLEDGTARFALGGVDVVLRLAGKANVMNALAAIAAAETAGITRDEAARCVASVEPPPMRGRLREGRRLRVYDDCYNANPLSFEAALATWAAVPAHGRRWVVAGDMRELGDASPALHEELGRLIARSGAEMVLAAGDFAADIVRGCDIENVEAVADAEEAAKRALELVRDGDLILVKGSRAVGLEKVVDALVGNGSAVR